MAVPVGLNVWSKLTEDTFPYLDRTAPEVVELFFAASKIGADKLTESFSRSFGIHAVTVRLKTAPR